MDPFQEVASRRLSLGLRVPQGRRFQCAFRHMAWEGLGHDMGDREDGWAVAWEQHQEAPGCEGTSTWQSAGNQSDPKA